jgi:hypothetical protein
MNYYIFGAECVHRWLIRTAALLAFWLAGSCLAGDAVFSNDGQRVYAIGDADNVRLFTALIREQPLTSCCDSRLRCGGQRDRNARAQGRV